MIRFQRSARMARGKQAEAMAWAKEVTEFLNQKFTETQLQAFSTRFGDISSIVWEADFADLATLDNYQQQIGEDQSYWELVGKARDLFIEGSVHDVVLASV